ncbi:hypothetical protein DMB65_01075 [Flavobacterium cheongpyeongense]|jgi:nitrogen fixation/metabolism regulation signal transduction histidine kinase|uniref:Uncharacterized protein n=1 Tax=Flavobacterium cheongpyeongense TaxID=2212651 RepID=A0A2V4BUE4_9FLAO|nr:hypothetical protein DMB65_01075 [Flavobacterium cheongpyeongense]
MDFLGGIFISIFLLIIIYSNFIFLKGLKRIEEKRSKYKIFFFLSSVIFPCFVVFIIAAILTSPALIEMSNLKFDMSNYNYRIIFGIIIFPPSILLNIYFSKFYLKRISTTKKENEIELIGTE